MDAEDFCQFLFRCLMSYDEHSPEDEEVVTSLISTFENAEIESSDDGLVVKVPDEGTFHIIVRKK